MIKFRDKIISGIKICPITGCIFDEKTGEIQQTYAVKSHRYLRFRGMDVHQIQVHTYVRLYRWI